MLGIFLNELSICCGNKKPCSSTPQMRGAKRLKKDDNADHKPTRTLLVSKIGSQEENSKIREEVLRHGDVREMYTIQDSFSVLFVMMYDIRASEKVFNVLKAQEKNVTYTISKYEIPREVDRCDESKNQGTLLLVSRDLEEPLSDQMVREMFQEFGDIKCIREYKTFQRFIEFYDSRSAIAAHKKLHEKAYGKGVIIIRFVWDISNKQRWSMIAETDSILKNLDIGDTSEHAVSGNKKIYDKNFFLKVLDDFIVENLDRIEKVA